MTERWQERAACRGRDVALWFSEDYSEIAEARAVCATCPVRDTCLAENLFEPYGVWGGKSERQRRLLRVGIKRPYGEWASCAGCVQPFRPTSARNKYCSPSCRNRAVRVRRMNSQGEVA